MNENEGIRAYRKAMGAAGDPPPEKGQPPKGAGKSRPKAGRTPKAAGPAAGSPPKGVYPPKVGTTSSPGSAGTAGPEGDSIKIGGRVLNAQSLSGFIKESSEGSPSSPGAGISGYRKAAGLLLLVGKDQAAEILKHFSEEEMEKIVHEVALIKNLPPEEAAVILGEFQNHRHDGAPLAGGVETAKQMLLDAFGREKGEALYRKYLPFDGGVPFSFLSDLEYNQIELLLKNESPRVISLVLSYIEPKKASLILEGLEPEVRLETVQRLARRAEIHPDVIMVMEEKFRDKIRNQGKIRTQEFDGKSALAGILRFMDQSQEENILAELAGEVGPEISETIREKIFTIQDILRISDVDFQNALRDYDDQELAVIIKGKPPMVREKFLTNVSERRRVNIGEESLFRGPMLKKDVDEATRDFLQYLRDLEEAGKIWIPRSEDEYV